MRIRLAANRPYINLGHDYISLLRLGRYDRFELVPHRFTLNDRYNEVKECYIELVIVVHRSGRKEVFNPLRKVCKVHLSSDIMEIMQYKIGQQLSGVISQLNDSEVVMNIIQTRKMDEVIPDFNNLNIESLKRRLHVGKGNKRVPKAPKGMAKPKKEPQRPDIVEILNENGQKVEINDEILDLQPKMTNPSQIEGLNTDGVTL